MFFGGPEFYHLIGDLKMSTIVAQNLVDMSEEERENKLEELQSSRVKELVIVLINRLKVFEMDMEDVFVSAALCEADVLKSKNFGPQLLEAIGFGYYNYAS